MSDFILNNNNNMTMIEAETSVITRLNEDAYVRKIYNKIGEHFDATRAYTWKWIEDFTYQYSDSHTIYDIGCGSGRNLRDSPTWIGVDNSETFINICKEKGFNVVHADMIKFIILIKVNIINYMILNTTIC